MEDTNKELQKLESLIGQFGYTLVMETVCEMLMCEPEHIYAELIHELYLHCELVKNAGGLIRSRQMLAIIILNTVQKYNDRFQSTDDLRSIPQGYIFQKEDDQED